MQAALSVPPLAIVLFGIPQARPIRPPPAVPAQSGLAPTQTQKQDNLAQRRSSSYKLEPVFDDPESRFLSRDLDSKSSGLDHKRLEVSSETRQHPPEPTPREPETSKATPSRRAPRM
jgi:hypothetical protein